MIRGGGEKYNSFTSLSWERKGGVESLKIYIYIYIYHVNEGKFLIENKYSIIFSSGIFFRVNEEGKRRKDHESHA